ncbi:MAG: alpha/beta hydrolase [Bdellovibrionaceae bacterium]|nr:alpha/beta hydrolase [Pseudobdellovibrionaceae bacterium]MDW8191144.1 alpha/beta hydrolase [Pseudobdellovibrionaceae bacterium]
MQKLDEHLILIRGLARNQEHWGPFKPKILDTFKQVEFLDLAGNGTEAHRSSFIKIEHYTDDLRKRSHFIGRQPKPILLGISLGGMVAIDWAYRFPQELKAIILINVSLGAISPPWKRLQPNALKYLKSILLNTATQDPFAREMHILRLVSQQKKSVKEKWAAQFSHVPPTALKNFLRQLVAAARFKGSIRKPQLPVLLLASKNDRMVNVDCSYKIHRFWRCALQIHDWGGHDLSFDDPDWVVDRLTDFLKDPKYFLR